MLLGFFNNSLSFVSYSPPLNLSYYRVEYRFHHFRFDGNNFKTEPSSNFPHRRVNVLGLYKGEAFVTGSNQPSNIKTEILDYDSNKWNQVADYPFSSNGDR